ncbi:MAG: DUF4167 domain-containing protein [Hyphomicrobiaceae bacterium]
MQNKTSKNIEAQDWDRMRQGQQNRRGRGRNNNNNNNNNNRKSHNPLARSFESNGPDVKIRGTPAHIAEKYMSLARDASVSGDPVLAENYLQHAEHYNRIIMAYREQQMQQTGGDGAGMGRQRPFGEQGEHGDDYGDEEGDDMSPEMGALPQRGYEPQPRVYDPSNQGQPQGGPRLDENGNPMPPRPPRHERQDRQGEGFRQHQPREGREFRPREPREPREQREPREFREPREPREPREQREPREPREFREAREPRPVPIDQPPPMSAPLPVDPATADQAPAQRQDRRRDRFGQGYEQPEFLRRPVRRPRREQPVEEVNGESPAPDVAPDKPVV